MTLVAKTIKWDLNGYTQIWVAEVALVWAILSDTILRESKLINIAVEQCEFYEEGMLTELSSQGILDRVERSLTHWPAAMRPKLARKFDRVKQTFSTLIKEQTPKLAKHWFGQQKGKGKRKDRM